MRPLISHGSTATTWLACLTALGVAVGLTVGPSSASANDGVSKSVSNYYAGPTTSSPNPAIGTVPPMGFNNWARFMCSPQSPIAALDGSTAKIDYSFQRFMEDNAQALSDSGLMADGYKTITVDDCWMYRNSSGYLHGAVNWGSNTDTRDTTKQPGFDYELTAYGKFLHGLGAKVGLYETSGTHTCSTSTPTSPNEANGSEDHEQADANSFVYWGVDQLKYDNCGVKSGVSTQTLDATMSADLATAAKNVTPADSNRAKGTHNILFDISAPAGYAPGSTLFSDLTNERTLGQTWRIGPDITTYSANSDPWAAPFVSNAYQMGPYASFDYALDLSRYQGPGNWNNADMLLIGDNGMTTAEERSQMSLWSILAHPLVMSTDARKFSPAYLSSIKTSNPTLYNHLESSIAILGNTDVIAVDQDPLGAGGYRVSGGATNSDGTPALTSGTDVVVKPLADGSRAVVVLNKNATSENYTLNLSSIGFNNNSCTYTVKDLWAGTSANNTSGSVSLSIASHDSSMLRIAAQNTCGTFTPRGQITASRGNWGNESLCLGDYNSATTSGSPVDVERCTGAANQQWQMNADGTIKFTQPGTNLCLTAQSSATTSTINTSLTGQWITVATCGSASATGYQTWSYNRDGNLKLQGTTPSAGKCIDVHGGTTTTPGTTVDLYSCGASPNSIQANQTWAVPYNAPPAS
ncbi:MAG: alpha-galactosidase [Catenulispora sp.]|nr:alpha-galactosidase [Catenulispora sp.]